MKTNYMLALALATALVPAAAEATSVTYSGSGATGVDPISSTWTFGPNFVGFYTFVEPLQNNEFPTFKGDAAAGLTSAKSLVFTYTGSDPEGFNMLLGSGLTHVATPQGAQWDTAYKGTDTVIMNAVGDDQLDIGDTFDIQVAFTNAINLADFSFTLTWSDQNAPVPEPATWAMMVGGFGLAGGMMRRRKTIMRFA